MFLDTLSTAVLRLCDINDLTYEEAAARCDISAKYYGMIARRESAISILVLEKICNGFQVTPNDLLTVPTLAETKHFQVSMPVTHLMCLPYEGRFTIYPICPKCGRTMEREYQHYCDRCGQRLGWKGLSKAIIVFPGTWRY